MPIILAIFVPTNIDNIIFITMNRVDVKVLKVTGKSSELLKEVYRTVIYYDPSVISPVSVLLPALKVLYPGCRIEFGFNDD